jgi:vacuolar-type H+-ATPase subunit E/Vma4
MGLDYLRDEILNQAKSKAKEIEKKTQAEIALLEQEAEKELAFEKTKSIEILDFAIKSLEKKHLVDMKTEEKQIILAKKKIVIDTLVDQVKEDLRNDKGLLLKLFEYAKKTIDVDRIYCKDKYKKLFRGVELIDSDIEGIIAEDTRSNVSIDLTFDTLVEASKQKKIQEIAEVLFK